MRKQKGVYWPPKSEETGGQDFNDYGQPQYADPVEIDCRWEDVAEEFIGPTGLREVSRSMVYVDRDVKPGGVLLLGELAGVADLASPKNNDGAWEIRQFDKTPNLRATEFLRAAYL
jgi:hypothetical protein